MGSKAGRPKQPVKQAKGTAEARPLFNCHKNRGPEFYTKVFHISTSGPRRKPEPRHKEPAVTNQAGFLIATKKPEFEDQKQNQSEAKSRTLTSKQDQDAGVGPGQNNNQSKDQSKDDTIAAQQDQKQAGPEA